ncbi:Bug family tripartite tricarboxylate transporter substrate binding protein [Comamonas serinivorans]|nr:tripartite tricarboxylate transporter substrate binding protein [Comamonas serinivorans]
MAAASGAALTVPGLAQAQADAAASYPNKAVRVVVPFAPGGGTDTLARLLGQKLQTSLGQPFVIDNKPGASGIIGTDAVAKAAPDGYTLSFGLSTSLLINQFLFSKLPYNPQKDLDMLYRVADGATVLVAKPGLPVKTGAELLAYIKANKGKLSYGSYGQGSFSHLMGAYLDHVTQGDLNHVAYKGESPMIQDLLGGQFDFCWSSAINTKQHIATGKLKAIGVNAPKQLSALPGVPTLQESGMKEAPFAMVGWLAMAVPAKTPKAIQEKLAAEIRTALKDPEVRRKIDDMGFGALDNSGPDVFAAEYKREMPRWQELVKVSGAKLD